VTKGQGVITKRQNPWTLRDQEEEKS